MHVLWNFTNNFNSVNKIIPWLNFSPYKKVTFTRWWLYSLEILFSGNSGIVWDLFQHPAQAQACFCFEKFLLWRLQELGAQWFPLFHALVRNELFIPDDKVKLPRLHTCPVFTVCVLYLSALTSHQPSCICIAASLSKAILFTWRF